ncbi:MAG TPA: UDP-N-acetylmuramoyl-tripeptide--D-alanyl-D-alanine ligase [Solirubrobacteraceae bacterium]|nr:UDP-N-acetylmuramoyl-tripeptide--D-alanyl-D-alanine ligase [Solirubrobacteraceae bacterium]
MRDWEAQRIARGAGAEAIAIAAPGDLAGPASVSVDSRAIVPGALFVGLRGERVDGGEFASSALAQGAWGVLVAPEHAGAAAALETGVVLAHPDPLVGLQSLARAWLARLRADGARVVAITGSTGKTSTKDILTALLSKQVATASSPANHNTEIGLPLAILGAPAGTRALVLEMAMRGAGQIAELTAIAEPEVGVIVNVGPVHLELLGTVEAVAAAKAELLAGLAPGASAVVPAGEPLLAPYLRADLRTLSFGAGGDFELVQGGEAGEARAAAAQVTIADRTSGERIALKPSFEQAHNLNNLLAAVAAARALGITPDGEVNVRFSALRGERLRLPEGIVLIDDCYNANPMSMRAALDELARSATGRRVAVLGDMLELGPRERELHEEIGAYAARRGVQRLVTVGPLAAAMAAAFTAASNGAAGRQTRATADAREAAAVLKELLAPGDTVLVKGSRGVGLERVGAALAGRS